MPKCPKCDKELEYLIERQLEWTYFKFWINRYGEEDYDIEGNPEPVGKVYYDCPECMEALAKSKKQAIAFLKGN